MADFESKKHAFITLLVMLANILYKMCNYSVSGYESKQLFITLLVKYDTHDNL